MRNSFHTNPLVFKIVVLLTCCMLVMMYNKSKAQGIKMQPRQTSEKKF